MPQLQKKQKFREKPLQLKWILLITSILSIVINWSYGNSYYAYLFTGVGVGIFSYITFLNRKPLKFNRLESAVLTCVIISIITSAISFINGNNEAIKSMILINVSLIFPLTVSLLNIDFCNEEKQLKFFCLIMLIIAFVMALNPSGWNSNSLGTILFSCLSFCFVIFKLNDSVNSKILSIIFFAITTYLVLTTGSRNAALVLLSCFVLLLLSDKFWKNKTAYRTVYIAAMLLTVFAAEFMDIVFSNNSIMRYLTDFTESFSEKAWGMEGHLEILLYVKNKVSALPIFEKLFGQGVLVSHSHNLFYQCLLSYGYVGTTIIYGVYIAILEAGHKLFREQNDRISLGCCIVIIGHFLMQIGEVYMLGVETAMIIALLPAGIILQRYRVFNESKNEKTEAKVQK